MTVQSQTTEEIVSCSYFEGARESGTPQDKRKAIVKAAAAFRGEALAQDPVPYYQSVSLVRVPYPTRYAYRNAFTLPIPLMHIVNRMFVIQFFVGEERKTLLVCLFSRGPQRNGSYPFTDRQNDHHHLGNP